MFGRLFARERDQLPERDADGVVIHRDDVVIDTSADAHVFDVRIETREGTLVLRARRSGIVHQSVIAPGRKTPQRVGQFRVGDLIPDRKPRRKPTPVETTLATLAGQR